MKKLLLSFLVLCFMVVHGKAQISEVKMISVDLKGQSISDALLHISEVANMNIGFQSNKIPKSLPKLSFEVKEERLSTVLQKVLKNTNLSYKINKLGIIVYETRIIALL